MSLARGNKGQIEGDMVVLGVVGTKQHSASGDRTLGDKGGGVFFNFTINKYRISS